MAINARGVFLGTKYSAARMIGAGTAGAIVNIASNAGLAGSPRIVGYSASKHAVIGITKSAAKAFATRNVRVNAICPAPTDTAMVRNLEQYSSAEQVRSALTAGTPMGRYGEPAEIAAAALFLSSAAASFITGAIVPVDGGSVA
jgi:NAD(P)-dependent dehydrogenase (short-subunit alcohol dehydrogenase family)